ncbi:related to ferric-chelate reductase [Phialocephala subalpina]|uniref:Related to ferric-chelate reductase n=1 Tax=Phialocephala subalpina TaxID=576137 RepID=A0A1L7XGJ7_9HELO|nr:related to ferric-chelate reductase [Phialocephala subalpina]
MPSNHSSPTHGGGNSTSSGAAAAAAARKAKMAYQRLQNQHAAKYYAAGVLGMIAIFAIFHWARYLYSLYASNKMKRSRAMKALVSIVRAIRHVLTHRVPGFTSIGHAVVVLIYVVINVVLTLTYMDWSNLTPISKRLGWMTLINTSFIVFLALKNTPLAFLTAYSYERLNLLHQVGGYSTIIFAFLHAITIIMGFEKIHRPAMLLELAQINGMTAVSALFVLLVFALLIRRVRYEVFYISHILMFMLFIITAAMHQPNIKDKAIIITILSGAMWGSDRTLRGLRILWYAYDNRATITPLPHGGTRIILRRSPSRSVPGTHCFLWIPKIRAIEMHPFTIVSKTPYSLELVVAAYDGFTNDLHKYAVKHPGTSLRASFDGPYGSLPDFARVADKVILIAGGSGASFTFGVALDICKKLRNTSEKTIEFIWTVREQKQISWFQKELAELQTSHRVNIILHATRPSIHEVRQSTSRSPISPVDEEKALHDSFSFSNPPQSLVPNSPILSLPEDPEKDEIHHAQTSHRYIDHAWSSTSSVNILPGRPDVDHIVKKVVSETGDDQRVVVAACGPDGLMWRVRKATAGVIRVGGPSVELHCEQFGW